MNNDFPWNLDDDHIIHETHLSKKWNKDKQKQYHHEWYLKNREKILKSRSASVGSQLYEAMNTVDNFTQNAIDKGVSAVKEQKAKHDMSKAGVGELVMNPGDDTDGRGKKYIAKVNTGKYIRYFYTQHELDVYNQQMALATNDTEKEEVLNLFNTYDVLPEEESEEDSRKAINPNFDLYDSGTSRNCMYCSEAYDLRRRGFDVKAAEIESSDNEYTTDRYEFDNPGVSLNGETNTNYYQIYNEKDDSYSSEDVNKAANDCLKDIQAEGPTARGIFIVDWGYGNRGSGHAINWYNYKDSDGKTKTKFVDSQNFEREPEDDCSEYAGYADKIGYYRTDNQIPITNGISSAAYLKQHVVPVNKPYLETAKKQETLGDKVDKKLREINKKIASTDPWLEDKYK